MFQARRSARLLGLLLGLVTAVVAPSLVAAPAQAATYTISGTITGPNAAGTIVNVPDVYITAYNGNETQVGSGYANRVPTPSR